MKNISVPTKRGVLLNGALFGGGAETVVIAITGIHGNFCSNPFYYNFGDTLNSGGIDFIYAQTCDAFGKIEPVVYWRAYKPFRTSPIQHFGAYRIIHIPY